MKNTLLLDEAAADELSEAIDGPKVILSLWLIQKSNCDLELAAFISFAACLSRCCKSQGGWFFLEQEKEPDPASASMFLRLGSWKHGVGLGKDAQLRVRERAKKMGILAKLPSKTRASRLKREREALQGDVEESQIPPRAFIFEQSRGAPPRLHYKVNQLKYIAWLTGK